MILETKIHKRNTRMKMIRKRAMMTTTLVRLPLLPLIKGDRLNETLTLRLCPLSEC